MKKSTKKTSSTIIRGVAASALLSQIVLFNTAPTTYASTPSTIELPPYVNIAKQMPVTTNTPLNAGSDAEAVKSLITDGERSGTSFYEDDHSDGYSSIEVGLAGVYETKAFNQVYVVMVGDQTLSTPEDIKISVPDPVTLEEYIPVNAQLTNSEYDAVKNVTIHQLTIDQIVSSNSVKVEIINSPNNEAKISEIEVYNSFAPARLGDTENPTLGSLLIYADFTGAISIDRWDGEEWVYQVYDGSSYEYQKSDKGTLVKVGDKLYSLGYYEGGNATNLVGKLVGYEKAGNDIKLTWQCDDVTVVQIITYNQGDQHFDFQWEITNNGDLGQDITLIHGQDTYLYGGDEGAGFWDPATESIGVTKSVDGVTQTMTLSGTGEDGPDAYDSMDYDFVYVNGSNGSLSNTIDPDPEVDNGYALQWNFKGLQKGSKWIVNARETFKLVDERPDAPTSEADDVNNVILPYTDAALEYSTDGGETWTEYNWQSEPKFVGNETVLVRFPANEALNIYPSKTKKLTFTATPAPEAPSSEADDVNDVILPYTDAGLEYSTDGGETWTEYDWQNEPKFEGNETVLVRFPANEALSIPASKTKELKFTKNEAPVATNVQVSGTAKEGNTLTGSYTFTDKENDEEGVTTFAWYRSDDANGTNKTLITGATAKTYLLTAADVGKFITFEVTPVAKAGGLNGQATPSSATSKVEKKAVVGQIGELTVNKPATLYKVKNGKMTVVRQLAVNEQLPVFSTHGILYRVGSGNKAVPYYVEQNANVRYNTPSKSLLQAAKSGKVVKWNNKVMNKSEIGRTTILKDTPLYSMENGERKVIRTLTKGSWYRVYQAVPAMYYVGDGNFVIMDSKVTYKKN